MGCNNSKSGASNASGGGGDKRPSSNEMITSQTVEGYKRGGEDGIDHGKFIVCNSKPIEELYDLDKKKLGEGTYGSVCKGKNKTTGVERAIKSMCKTQMKGKNAELFKQEIACMKMMDHPNILKLYETFEDMHNIYLVLEMCSGGELFQRIIEVGNFTEPQSAVVMQQILRGIYYMHEMKLTHRDLKPENFLMQTKDEIEKTNLKIIDFGLSCKCADDQKLKTKAGTAYYIAPQVLAGSYGKEADIWSCGVIMFVLLAGYPPFYADSDKEVLELVKAGNFTFRRSDWKNISEDAKDLVQCMIKMDPNERYTAPQALQHTWIKDKAPKASDKPLPTGLLDNMKHFRAHNLLKKAALHVIANQMNDAEIQHLREVFQALDSNGDGVLTCQEMKEGLQNAGLKEIPANLQEIMEQVDSDGSGEIDYTEFLAATLDKHHYMQEDVCWAAFRIFDLDGNGKISQEELQQVLHNGNVEQALGAEAIVELMKECDENGDGEIDFQEFMAMMRGEHKQKDKICDDQIVVNEKGVAA